jgi:outer membrane protein OmpA-like peptidoglycan-associated protein
MKILYVSIILLCSFNGHAQPTCNVYFEFNRYRLTDRGRLSIDSFFLVEKHNIPKSFFNLYGHCDSIGANDFNDKLSAKRVAAVRQYLVSKGIRPGGIAEEAGYGKKDPLYDNASEDGRQLNRRVEIVMWQVVETKAPGVKELEQLLSLTEKIADTATKAGTTIALNNINFYGGGPLPLPESFNILDELLEIMRVNYNLVIEIRGHICCVSYPGDIEYRNTGNGLSEERARTVFAYLTGNGIETSRVSYKGYGHSLPIYPYPEKTEEERTANRRVEIKIISK